MRDEWEKCLIDIGVILEGNNDDPSISYPGFDGHLLWQFWGMPHQRWCCLWRWSPEIQSCCSVWLRWLLPLYAPHEAAQGHICCLDSEKKGDRQQIRFTTILPCSLQSQPLRSRQIMQMYKTLQIQIQCFATGRDKPSLHIFGIPLPCLHRGNRHLIYMKAIKTEKQKTKKNLVSVF